MSASDQRAKTAHLCTPGDHERRDTCAKVSYRTPIRRKLEERARRLSDPLDIFPFEAITIRHDGYPVRLDCFDHLSQTMQQCRFPRSHILRSTVHCQARDARLGNASHELERGVLFWQQADLARNGDGEVGDEQAEDLCVCTYDAVVNDDEMRTLHSLSGTLSSSAPMPPCIEKLCAPFSEPKPRAVPMSEHTFGQPHCTHVNSW